MFRKLFSAFKKEQQDKDEAEQTPQVDVTAEPPVAPDSAATDNVTEPAGPSTEPVQEGPLLDAFVELGLMSSEEASEYDQALAQHEEELEQEIKQWREKTRHTWYGKLRDRLGKTKGKLIRRLEEVLGDRMTLDADTLEEVEEVLIEADLGVQTTRLIMDRLEAAVDEKTVTTMADVKAMLKDILMEQIGSIETEPLLAGVTTKPAVIMVVGVNGVGKTTTIGKLASQYRMDGKSVLIAAADTFRAGAIEQVEVWARRVGVHIVKHAPGADAAAVVFDSLQAAKARGTDIVIVDTAGRLHTKFNLMEEVKKIHRIIGREIPGAPHAVLQVIDATTGQNGIMQARKFKETNEVTGIALTKLDGTAKGGIVVAIARELNIPIQLIGIGEGVTDLRTFNGREFVNALFE